VETERVEWFSEGLRIVGVLKRPVGATGRLPTIVQGPGWLGLASSPTSPPFHERFIEAGYAVLTFDYRGFGQSEGERGWVRPAEQIIDIRNALTWVETRDDLDAKRMGLFGLGGTGGGNAIIAGATDPRVRCVVAMSVVADGAQWMRHMRREYEWTEFQERVAENRRRRVLTGEDEIVDPREDLMVATPERRAEASRAATDASVGSEFHLATADALLAFRPIDVVHRLAPRGLLMTCMENDVVTPEDHAFALFEAAGTPKMLIRQTGVKHYESYRLNLDALSEYFVAWLDRFIRPSGEYDPKDDARFVVIER
jgi:uncharacterized protein